MGFNKNTWSKDYTGAKGIFTLGQEDAKRKGYKVKTKKNKEVNKKEGK